MAEAPEPKIEKEIEGIRDLLWGATIKWDIFRRWSQGFEFSDVEPSALVQRQGGPCAVIAPVQAYLLKNLLLETTNNQSVATLTPDKCKTLLIQSLCNILLKCKVNTFRIVQLREIDVCQEAQEVKASTAEFNSEMVDTREIPKIDVIIPPESEDAEMNSLLEVEWSPTQFHERLSVSSMDSIEEVEQYFTEHYDRLCGKYGVLLFMYTVMMTKSLENIMAELLDTSEALIHDVYGYASQALINLMLTGRAVAHVWDNVQDVGGLELPGIDQQSDVGFITLMEQMRYITVGSFYKNPKNPVWIMGSETHLTVLFSNEKKLVSPETPCEVAKRVFKSFDPYGNNFIPTTVLQEVLSTLNLVSETEYVDIMLRKLDAEGLGIILLNAFMDEFFPEDERSMPDTFDLMHYNGIPGSNDGHKIRYNKGSAILLESDLKSMCNLSNPMLTCLQTKWPTIEVNWVNSNRTPSLN